MHLPFLAGYPHYIKYIGLIIIIIDFNFNYSVDSSYLVNITCSSHIDNLFTISHRPPGVEAVSE